MTVSRPGRSALALLLAIAPPVAGQVRSGTTAAGLYYEVSGAGEPVVLIHAFSVDRRMWDPQVAAFERSFTVIRYDLRGHGKSAPTSVPYVPYDDLASVMDALGVERAALVGLSAGAQLAIDFAIAYPRRVTRLVLAAPGLGGYASPTRLTWLQPVFDAAATGDAEQAARLWADTPIMKLYSDTAAAPMLRRLVMSNAAIWAVQRNPARPLIPPAIGRLSEISAPTLVLIGERDLPHIQEVAGLLEKGITGAKRVTVPGAGHIVNLDARQRFNNEVMTFLGSR